MHDIRLDLVEFFPDGPDAPLISRTKPSGLRNMEAVIPDIRSQLFRGIKWLLRARNNMDLERLDFSLSLFY